MIRVATITAVVEHHAQDAAFLWSRRRREIDGPVLGEDDIGRIDQRLDANLEGLFASGSKAWRVAKAQFLDYAEPAELFVLGALALYWQEGDLVSQAIEAARPLLEDGLMGLSGAISRTTSGRLKPYVGSWLDSADPFLRCLGLSALWHARTDAGARLKVLAGDEDRGVRQRALRLAGAMRRRDLLPLVMEALTDVDPYVRLMAGEAMCLLEEPETAYPVLDKLAFDGTATGVAAVEMRLLATPRIDARRWLQQRLDQTITRQAALAAIGLVADVSIMPWLFEKMRQPGDAYAAGFALRDLLEIDFNDTDVFVTDPAVIGKEFGEIEDLPLPFAERAEKWWDQGRGVTRHAKFQSMRRIRLQAIRTALANPQLSLVNWQRTRQFRAWM